MSPTQVEIASQCDSLFIDGTFSITPEPFFQVLFINGKNSDNDNVFPIATALMPNKLETSYRDVLEKIQDICQEHGYELEFVYAHCDCEYAIINAIRVVFPCVQVRLCRFHVVDAIRRQADGRGLRRVINSHSDFKKLYTRSRQVFFFPTELWPQLWEHMKKQLSDATQDIEAVQNFLVYMVSSCFN